MKPRMNVYLTIARKVLMYAYPTILSLFERNQESEIYLYLASEDLEEADIQKEKQLADRYGNHVVILHFDEDMAKGKIVSASEHWPVGTLACYWLFHELLPADVDRIMALESDAIVTGSLKEFYETDMNGYYAACPDPEHKPISHRKLMEQLGGDVLTFVVSLYNVKAIQRDFTLEEILEADQYVIKAFGHSQQELTFGLLFKDKVKFLDAGNLCIEENRQSMESMGFDYLTGCENRCKVLHFSSTGDKEKPWNPVYIMPGYYEWWKYAQDSPYFAAYFEAQWKSSKKKTEEMEALKRNITWKNVLLMILIIYFGLMLGAGIICRQSLLWETLVISTLLLAIIATLVIRKLSMWISVKK